MTSSDGCINNLSSTIDGIATFGSQFGTAGGGIVLSDVMCDGTEFSLSECPSAPLGTITDEACSLADRAAGVICVAGGFDKMTCLHAMVI